MPPALFTSCSHNSIPWVCSLDSLVKLPVCEAVNPRTIFLVAGARPPPWVDPLAGGGATAKDVAAAGAHPARTMAAMPIMTRTSHNERENERFISRLLLSLHTLW